MRSLCLLKSQAKYSTYELALEEKNPKHATAGISRRQKMGTGTLSGGQGQEIVWGKKMRHSKDEILSILEQLEHKKAEELESESVDFKQLMDF
jgi:transcriptional regulator GlxA family with amidase domain